MLLRQKDDKDGIKHHVCNTRGRGDDQSELGLFRRDKEALEQILQHVEGQGAKDDAGVNRRVSQHGAFGTQQGGNGADEHEAEHGKHNAEREGNVYEQGEEAVCLLTVALAHGLGDDGGAARAEHEAHGGEDHEEGYDEVDCGKRGLSRKVGDEEAVYHTVNGSEDHHDDGRHGKTDQSSVIKVVGKLNFHFVLSNQRIA